MEKFKTYPFDKNVLVGSHGTIKTYYKYRTPLTMYDSVVILKKARVLLHNLYVKDKYYVVRCKNIRNDIKSPEEKVHRLVAITWCKGYKHGLEVNHIDGNKLNNHYKNLEWVTHAENITKYYKLKKQNEITMEQELDELELFEKDMEKLVERMKVTSKKMRKLFKKIDEVENKKVVKTKK